MSDAAREASAQARGRWVTTCALAAYWVLLLVATHLPKVPRPIELDVSDKWQHYVAYGVLGFLLAAWLAARRATTWLGLASVLAVAVTYGGFDEMTQPFFGREADLLDWRADCLGAASGVALFWLLHGAWRAARGRPAGGA